MSRLLITFRCLLSLSLWGWLLAAQAELARAQGGPPGAGVSDLLVSESTAELVYAATDLGVFRSDNAGLSWAAINNGLTNLNVSSLAGRPPALFAATVGDGVFRSADGGRNWEAVNAGLADLNIFSLAVHPSNPDVLYAGAAAGGIFKSTDRGAAWTPISSGLAEGSYLAIAIDPENPDVVYAANASAQRPGFGRLFKSTDGGMQWVEKGTGAVPLTLAIEPSDSNTLYVGTSDGITKSIDGGQSVNLARLAGFSIVAVQVDPGDPNIVYTATRFNGVVKSLDAGATWQTFASGLPLTELLDLTLDPTEPQRLYAGTNGIGVFRSLDGAQTWQLASSGMDGADVQALALNPQSPGEIMAGVAGGELFRSADAGESWEEARQDLFTRSVLAIAFDPSNPSTVYAGSANPVLQGDGSLFRSTDGGARWQLLLSQVPIFSLAVDPSQPQTVYIGTGFGVFKSTNGGQNFSDANDVRGSQDNVGFWTVRDLAIDPNNPRRIYAAVSDNFGQGQVFRTTNGAGEWESVGFSSTQPLLRVAVDPRDSNVVYVGSPLGVTRSINGGEDFLSANNGFPGQAAITVLSFAIDTNDSSAVYAATAAGVFKSTNRGDSWVAANAGLEQVIVRVLRVNPLMRGVLYAATAGGGVFKTIDGGATWTPTSSFVGSAPIISRVSIVGAAGFDGGGVSPGEIVAIFGRNIGPLEGVQPSFDPATGKLRTETAGVTVFFGDVPAPLFFVRADQINAQVPFEIAGLDAVEVRVVVDSETSNRAKLPVLESHPGVFDFMSNQDLTRNSPENPESPGNVVVLAATGAGLLNPMLMSGQPAGGAPFSVPLLSGDLTIGGQPAVIEFAGATPGFVGLLQVNARIPLGLASGPQPVTLRVGEAASLTPATLYVE